jgi:hypothetical protein
MKRNFKVKNKYYKEWVHTADLDLKDGSRDSILTWIYKTNLVPWYATYILQKPYEDDLVQDLIGELYLIICEIKEEKWNELYQQGKFAISGYVTGIIKQQIYSDSSRIYYKYYKYANKEITMNEDFWLIYSEEH